MIAGPSGGRRRCLLLVFFCGFSIILFRLVTLQVLQASELTTKAQRQHEKTVPFEGARGMVWDRHGKVLAINVELPSIFAEPRSVESVSSVTRQLVSVLHGQKKEFERKLREKKGFVWLARKVDSEQGRQIERLSLEGIGVVMEGRRFYPNGPLLAHVLGFSDMDGKGREGIEGQYDQYLRGEKVVTVMERDALGRAVFPKDGKAQTPTAGHALTLTVDEVIQFIVEKELEEAVTRTHAKSGTMIVMDPQSGAILAMAVSPRFDPNVFSSLPPDRVRNRTVTDTYEPGSTMKALVAAAALEENVITPTSMVFAENGHMQVANTIIHDHEKMGWITFSEVIQKSSNIGAAKTGMLLGEERLYRYLQAFGFGHRTEIDLPGEVSGLLKTPKSWGRRSLASISMGQEIAVTPLQMVSSFATLANGGIMMKPYVVAKVHDQKGLLIKEFLPEVKRRVVSSNTAQILTRILEGVVTNGTAQKASISGFRVAGKTGTAQKPDPRTHGYSTTQVVASFVGYVPAESPRLAMIVVIDEPQTDGGWGGTVAAPVFRRVGEQALNYLGVSGENSIKIALAMGDN